MIDINEIKCEITTSAKETKQHKFEINYYEKKKNHQ